MVRRRLGARLLSSTQQPASSTAGEWDGVEGLADLGIAFSMHGQAVRSRLSTMTKLWLWQHSLLFHSLVGRPIIPCPAPCPESAV